MGDHQVSNFAGHLTVADQRLLARLNLLSQYIVQSGATWRPFAEWIQKQQTRGRPIAEKDGLNVVTFIEDQAHIEDAVGKHSKYDLLSMAFPPRGTEGAGM